MKKTILLAAALVAGSAFAETKSTTTIDTSKKSIADRIGVAYYGVLDKANFRNEGPNTELYNMILGDYELDGGAKLQLQPIFSLVDSTQDRFAEADVRIGIKKKFAITDDISYSINPRYFIPTSRGSQEDDKLIGTVRINNTLGIKIDDVNGLLLDAAFQKTINSEATASVDETSRYMIRTYASYTNTKLSEKTPIRIDYAGRFAQMAGKSDLALEPLHTIDTIYAGVNPTVSGTSIYPNVYHKLSNNLQPANLGIALEMYRKF